MRRVSTTRMVAGLANHEPEMAAVKDEFEQLDQAEKAVANDLTKKYATQFIEIP